MGTTRPANDSNPKQSPSLDDEDRYPRSRFLETTTLALGGLVALAVALPTAGFALLPSLTGSAGALSTSGRSACSRKASSSSRRSSPTRRPARSRGAPRTCATTGWSTGGRASRSCPAAARTSVVRRNRTGPLFADDTAPSTRRPARWASCRHSPPGSAARVTAASSTTRATAPQAPRRAPSTGTSSRSATVICVSGASTASAASSEPERTRRSAASRSADAGQPVTGPESFLYPVAPGS